MSWFRKSSAPSALAEAEDRLGAEIRGLGVEVNRSIRLSQVQGDMLDVAFNALATIRDKPGINAAVTAALALERVYGMYEQYKTGEPWLKPPSGAEESGTKPHGTTPAR